MTTFGAGVELYTAAWSCSKLCYYLLFDSFWRIGACNGHKQREGAELGKAQSMFCAEIPLFASINQNSCYHSYPTTPSHRSHYLHCHPTHSCLLSLPLSLCTYTTRHMNIKPKKEITPNAPPASKSRIPHHATLLTPSPPLLLLSAAPTSPTSPHTLKILQSPPPNPKSPYTQSQ